MADARSDWRRANRRHLLAALDVVRARLADHLRAGGGRRPAGVPAFAAAETALATAAAAMPSPSMLQRLAAALELDPAETLLLAACAGVELDGAFANLCDRAQGETGRSAMTFSLALAVLPDLAWDALAPDAPLRAWRLLRLDPEAAGVGLTTAPLAVDEATLHLLAGTPVFDPALAGLVEGMAADGATVPSHDALGRRLAAAWSAAVEQGAVPPVLRLVGGSEADRTAVATALCGHLSIPPFRLAAEMLPAPGRDLDDLVRRWNRWALVMGGALAVDADGLDAADAPRNAALRRLLRGAVGPLLVCAAERRPLGDVSVITAEVARPTADEQLLLWRRELEGIGGAGDLAERLVAQFDLPVPMLRAAAVEARGELSLHAGDAAAPAPDAAVWAACRRQARPRLDDLARRADGRAGWDDLVLPSRQIEVLREIALQVRHRFRVHGAWGFAAGSSRGLGLAALFHGDSGTGKTLAAEVLAAELDLDLYRIELAAVISKYIGETEKNLSRIFDAAEGGGAILLFDEADALFGKRSEVKDSHDRHANVEIAYLLQRMETYRGLSVLTTNMKDSLDVAFLRRLRFQVAFPFPERAARRSMWRRVYPPTTPVAELDFERLGELTLSGGSIRNVALNAAFLAAADGGVVTMHHLLAAARSEYRKLDRPLTDADLANLPPAPLPWPAALDKEAS